MRTIDVLGVPSSMGGFSPGQERAPRALRGAGLLERIDSAGLDVRDRGDSRVRRWFPDTVRPLAQHVEAVRTVTLETAARVAETDGMALVLGGDCTIELGTVAGLQASREGRLGLIYFDLHADLNVPSSVSWGAMDSMGMAHALAVEGTEPVLAKAFPRTPLLDPSDLFLFAHGEGMEGERAHIANLGIGRTPVEEVEADPGGAATRTLDAFGGAFDHLAVHLDVDVIDFVSLPLSENANRNEGLSFEAAMEALSVLLAHPAVASLTIGELNPDHDPDGSAVPRFVAGLVGALPSKGDRA
jgi:arginase